MSMKDSMKERLDEAASTARKLLVLIEAARARESSDRLLAAVPPQPPSIRATPEQFPKIVRALRAYVEGGLVLGTADALALDDGIARLLRAADAGDA